METFFKKTEKPGQVLFTIIQKYKKPNKRLFYIFKGVS